MELPPQFKNAPAIQFGNELYQRAFLDLSSCRQIAEYGEGPISWKLINEWCDRYNIDPDTREDLQYVIPQVDAKYLEFRNNQIADQLKK